MFLILSCIKVKKQWLQSVQDFAKDLKYQHCGNIISVWEPPISGGYSGVL